MRFYRTHPLIKPLYERFKKQLLLVHFNLDDKNGTLRISVELIMDPEIMNLPYSRLVLASNTELFMEHEEDPPFKYYQGSHYQYARTRSTVDGRIQFKTIETEVAQVNLLESDLNATEYNLVLQEMDKAFEAMRQSSLKDAESPVSENPGHNQQRHLNLEQIRHLEEIRNRLPFIVYIKSDYPDVEVHFVEDFSQALTLRLTIKHSHFGVHFTTFVNLK